MDFFEHQDRARKNTKVLVVYFAIAVACIIASVYVASLLILYGTGSERQPGEPLPELVLWDPQLLLYVVLGTLGVVIIGSLYKTAALSKGGSAVAEALGGRLISPDTSHPEERKLRNVIEEMAIASGVPVPKIYVLDDEKGINAFAAGHTPGDAAIGVTRGCMTLLSRDELQGVIGHEFSHVLNGDMRLNLRLMGIVFGILCLAVIGRILIRTRGRKNPLPLLGLTLIVIGGIGVFFGRLIKAAVSRQREYLADASAVQFTRNPDGLAGALKKIGGLSYGSRLKSPHASEASHMFFGNGVKASLLGLLDTHPPLETRIRALEPGFDGAFARLPAVPRGRTAVPPPGRAGTRASGGVFPFPALPRTGGRMDLPLAPPVMRAAAVMSNVGRPGPAHLRYAEELRDAIPEPLKQAAHDALGASALVYGILISCDEAIRVRQLPLLQSATSAEIVRETLRLLPEVQPLATRARLPLMDLALPSLRQLSPTQFQQFRSALRQLVECDSEIDLFEYVLQKAVLRHLEPQFIPERKTPVQYYALKPLLQDCAVLLSGLARLGTEDAAQAERSFEEGAAGLSHAGRSGITLVPAERCGLADMDAGLNRLAQAVPQIKKLVLEGCARCVAADGLIREKEAELLRAIADSVDCPLPPWLPAAGSGGEGTGSAATSARGLPQPDATRT